MRKKFFTRFLLAGILSIFFCRASAQTNKEACERVESHLKIIKEFVANINPDSSMRRIESIAFLENLSGIEGSDFGSDIGKYSVTIEDYKKWKDWYEENKQRLFYNKKTKKVEIIKRRQ